MINDKMKIIAEQQSQRVVLKGNTIKDGNTIYSVKSPFYFSTKLPHEYQEVEYIETNGTQYIDTGVMPTNDIGFKLTLKVNSPNDQIICGVQTLFQVGANDTKIYYGWNGVNTADQYRKNANHDNFHSVEHNYLNSKRALFDNVDDTSHLVAGGYTNLSLVNQTIDLFCRKETNGNNQYFASISLKECKITNGTTLVRDFIPCYRVSDNVIGLYDLVNGQFYTNNGTGVFTKGNDVGLKPLTYIRTKRVDLGTLNWNSNSGTFPTNVFYNTTDIDVKVATQFLNYSKNLINSMYISSNGKIILTAKENYSSANEIKQALNGVILEYETAEPLELNGIGTNYDTYENHSGKVVRKIGGRKIGELTWYYQDGYFYAFAPSIKSFTNIRSIPPVICSDYQTISMNRVLTTLNALGISQDANKIVIKDANYTSVSALVSAKADVYVRYVVANDIVENERSVLVDHRYNKVVDSNGNEIDTE